MQLSHTLPSKRWSSLTLTSLTPPSLSTGTLAPDHFSTSSCTSWRLSERSLSRLGSSSSSSAPRMILRWSRTLKCTRSRSSGAACPASAICSIISSPVSGPPRTSCSTLAITVSLPSAAVARPKLCIALTLRPTGFASRWALSLRARSVGGSPVAPAMPSTAPSHSYSPWTISRSSGASAESLAVSASPRKRSNRWLTTSAGLVRASRASSHTAGRSSCSSIPMPPASPTGTILPSRVRWEPS